ncbi:MAG TPA: sulfotransferase domain-containing protein [Steroidobacteraceae bacterium]|nr:sulfotransferase domain-containing protein [Steroidobacteraceae bacterium]
MYLICAYRTTPPKSAQRSPRREPDPTPAAELDHPDTTVFGVPRGSVSTQLGFVIFPVEIETGLKLCTFTPCSLSITHVFPFACALRRRDSARQKTAPFWHYRGTSRCLPTDPISASPVVSKHIVRRRSRLIIDYQFQTESRLDTHVGRTDIYRRIALLCFTIFRRQFLTHYFGTPPRWRVWIRKLLKERVLPDFCIIGPAKSGTSDLAVTIMSHPNVLHPLVKEFSSSDPLAWRPFYPTLRAVKRHTQRHGVTLCPFIGPYLHFADIPTTLSELCPNTKIIINLRNPADLIFSEWKWIILHTETQLVRRIPFLATFPAYVQKAIELFPEVRLPFGPTLQNGIYATSVSHWQNTFGKHNVRVFDIAEYFNDRSAYLERVDTFLGLPNVSLPHNLPVVNHNPLEGLSPTPETRAQLREFFEPYNRRLWEVIGTSFPW